MVIITVVEIGLVNISLSVKPSERKLIAAFRNKLVGAPIHEPVQCSTLLKLLVIGVSGKFAN